MLLKLKKYIKRMVELDNLIEQVVIIGSFVNDGFNSESDIDLCICFKDEGWSDWQEEHQVSYSRIFTLKDKLYPYEKSLNIGHPIDLSFICTNGDIFGLGGLISGYSGEHLELYQRMGEQVVK
jgi:predicted nucleotidyltransferase